MNVLHMPPVSSPRPLKVVLLSLPERTEAVLEFFFASSGASHFEACAEVQADAAVFDLDTAPSLAHWQAFHQRTGRPGIALSTLQREVEGAIWVSKPVTPAAMLAAASRVAAQVAAAAQQVPACVLALVDSSAPEVSTSDAVAAMPTAPSTAPVPESLESAPEPEPAPAPMPGPISAATSPAAPQNWLQRMLTRWFGKPPRLDMTDSIAAMPPKVAAEPEPEPGLTPTTAPAPSAEPIPRIETVEPEPESVEAVPPALEWAPEQASGMDVATEVAEAPTPQSGLRALSAEELANDVLLCGNGGNTPLEHWLDDASCLYRPALHLIDALREASLVSAKWQVPTRVDLDGLIVVVDTRHNQLHVEPGRAHLPAALLQEMPRRLKTRTLNHAERQEWRDRLTTHGDLLRLDQALWRCGLETSVGRLPEGFDLQTCLYLKQWPNLTRLDRTPHAMRIAALWATRGATLADTVQTLNIAPRHAIAFYNAARALDLITEDGSQIRRAQRKAGRNRKVLSRLLGWLNR